MNNKLELLAGAAIASALIAAPAYLFFYEPRHRPFRKFQLQSGEVIHCRQMAGNAKYGIDFWGCRDGVVRHNVSGLVLETRP